MSPGLRTSAWFLASLAAVGITLIATSQASAGLVAPRSDCKGQKNVHAPGALQQRALRCLINYARTHAGTGRVNSSRSLEQAAGQKSGDVMRCGFSHTACGKPADLYPHRYGYTSASSWQWGENLAYGRGKRGTPRKILKAWLDSPPHRETMLRGSFDDVGIGLRRGGFSGHHNVAVWALELGCHSCS